MKTNVKEILRWAAITAFGGFGVWTFVSGSYHVITHSNSDWVGSLFGVGFLVLFATPFFVVAYICFRRRYRELYTVLGVVAAIVVFGVLIALPRNLHIYEFYDRHHRDMPWIVFLGLPVSLVCLFGPFYAAAWILRLCRRLSQRPTIESSERPPASR